MLIDEEVEEVSAGKGHAGAVTKGGRVWMWGANRCGQLGTGDFEGRVEPNRVEVGEEGTGIKIACGSSFTVVQSSGKYLYSSGSNLQGQLGQSTSLPKSPTFGKVAHLTLHPSAPLLSLSASDFCACLFATGALYLWGPSPIGQFNSP